MTELEKAAKLEACYELAERVRNRCLGLESIDQWAFQTGLIFGEYVKELNNERLQENRGTPQPAPDRKRKARL